MKEVFMVDDKSDIRTIFAEAAGRLKDPQLAHKRTEMLEGINAARSVLMDIYKTEENFLNAPKIEKKLFLHSLSTTSLKAKLMGSSSCNGISCFSLWVLATITEQTDVKAEIEAQFTRLQNGDWS